MASDTSDTCTLGSCHICTGCFHGHHDECRGTVPCPPTGEVHVCRCCGESA